MRKFAQLLGDSRDGLAAVVTAGALAVVLSTFAATFVRVYVDDYLVQGRSEWLVPLLAAMLTLGLLRMAATSIQLKLVMRLQNKLVAALSGKFIWRMLSLPIEYVSARAPGELSSRSQLPAGIAGAATGLLAQALVSFIGIVVYFCVMMTMDATLALAVAVAGGMQLLLIYAMQRELHEQTFGQ